MKNKHWKINGYIPDKRDERDFIAKAPLTLPPVSYDLRQYAREIENQGGVGSCVGNATSSCLELYAKSILAIDKNFSRLFIYWNARELGGISGDNGAYLRDGIKSCNKWGIPEENFWEYNESVVNDQPNSTAYQEARKNRVITYQRIINTDRVIIKDMIASGKSIIMGIILGRDFYDITGPIAEHDYDIVSQDNEQIGGHAMNIVGYDDNLNGGSYIVENSWGTDWGDNGYFALKYSVLETDGEDVWACTELKIDMLSTDADYVPEETEPEPRDNDPEIDIENFIQEANEYFVRPIIGE